MDDFDEKNSAFYEKWGGGVEDNDYDNDYDNDNDNDNDNDYEQEPTFVSSITDIERVSFPNECGITSSNDFEKKHFLTPLERFKNRVGGISMNFNARGEYNITIQMSNEMCRKADDLDNVKYLNPTAYILGYLVTNGGRGIDKKVLKNILETFDDDSVKPPDIIRYSRFWMKNS